jgi:hypothetical protein
MAFSGSPGGSSCSVGGWGLLGWLLFVDADG